MEYFDQIRWAKINENKILPHPSSPWSYNKNICQSCRAKTSKFCSVCRKIFYCSQHCQHRDYELHKLLCNHLCDAKLIPNEKDLRKNIKSYNMLNKSCYNSSIIYFVFFYGLESKSIEAENYLIYSCAFKDPLLLRFLLQCNFKNHVDSIIPHDGYSRSDFHPEIVQTLIEYRQPVYSDLSSLTAFEPNKEFAAWFFEQTETSRNQLIHKELIDAIFICVHSYEWIKIFAEYGLIDLEEEVVLKSRYFRQYESWEEYLNTYSSDEKLKIKKFIQIGLQNRSKIPQSIQNKRHFLIYILGITSVLVDIIFLYAPETLLF